MRFDDSQRRGTSHGLGFAGAIFRALLPNAERSEVLDDIQAEHHSRVAREGRLLARLWLWRQLFGSMPSLVARAWWRGWTGFEPPSSRWQPGGLVLESWIMDLRYSARRLASRPTYAFLAVLTLALGAGGTAAIFSIVRALLLNPLPVAHEEQLGVLWFDGSWTEQEFLHFRPDFPASAAWPRTWRAIKRLIFPASPYNSSTESTRRRSCSMCSALDR